MTKLIFVGCLSKEQYQDTINNAVKIIQKLDPEYEEIDDVPCCGSLLFHTSTDDETNIHVQDVHNWFKSNDVSDIITICAGCYNYLTRYYKEIISDFNINVKHILQFIAEDGNIEKLNLKYPGKRLAVNYHDPCHLKNAVNPILNEPRKILESIENIEFKEMENYGKLSLCCGSGGGVYSIFKENSDYNALAIFKQMRRTKLLLTSCPFCYTAFKRIYDDRKNKVRTPIMKFEDFIVKLMEGVDPLA